MSNAPNRPTENDPHDPDQVRMSLGDHLEELRFRIIRALWGFAVAAILCSIYGEQTIALFCRPLIQALLKAQVNPQMYFTSAGDVFGVYIDITTISSLVVASPWIIWQLWQFVGAGLYTKERKAIWRYAPLSIFLMLAGVAMCYFVVLPLALHFFITFGGNIPLNLPTQVAAPTTQPAMTVPVLPGDPANPVAYQLWFDSLQQRLKFALPDAQGVVQTMVIPFGPKGMVAPLITLPEYVAMVLRWLLVFAVAFQLPLVTLAVVSIGLVELATLRRFRKYVYFALMVISAILIPELLSGMLALMLPLWGLYELGIGLAWWSLRKKAQAARNED